MRVSVALLSRDQVEQLPRRAREVVESRKSGLSLNHIQGCPLDCAYCIRHTYGLWDQRMPKGAHDRDESGRGLLIVAGLSKQWNYYRLAEGGKWVWAELDIPADPGLAPSAT